MDGEGPTPSRGDRPPSNFSYTLNSLLAPDCGFRPRLEATRRYAARIATTAAPVADTLRRAASQAAAVRWPPAGIQSGQPRRTPVAWARCRPDWMRC
eukprot:ctg_148.g112